jgi:hypothetical protein
MADLTKLKRKSTLGSPPPITEASANLEAPEHAPHPPVTSLPLPPPAPQSRAGGHRHDGRSARRTGRTVQFATRVSSEFDERLRTIATRDSLLLVEVLERALDAYEARSENGKEGNS